MVVVVVVVVVGGCAFAAAGVVDSIWKSDPEPERLVLIRQLTGSGLLLLLWAKRRQQQHKISYSSPLRPPSRLFSIPLGQQHRGLDFLEPLEMIAC